MNILITGASRGIGLAEAKLFDKPGNKLFLVATSESSFSQSFEHATLIGEDLSRPGCGQKLAEKLNADTDTIDVLINNVGVMIMKKFDAMEEADINSMLDVNLRSHMMVTRAMLPFLRAAKRPQIVFMSSMAAKSSLVGESVYAATKSGLSNFANVLRNEFASAVRVSTVHAWGVDTWGASDPESFIAPEDVAEAVEFIVTRPDTMMVESIDLGNPS